MHEDADTKVQNLFLLEFVVYYLRHDEDFNRVINPKLTATLALESTIILQRNEIKRFAWNFLNY